MAQKPSQDDPYNEAFAGPMPRSTAASEPATVAEDGAGPGDECVWVRFHGSPDIQRCYAKAAKGRQIMVGGQMCEHVGEGPDGAWLYEERRY